MMAMTIYNVQISFAPADQGRAWNFQISGVYQQVMLARGMIMKECPVQVRSASFLLSFLSIQTQRASLSHTLASPLPFLPLPHSEPRSHQGRALGHPRLALLQAVAQGRGPPPAGRHRLPDVCAHRRREQHRRALDAFAARWRQQQRRLVGPRDRAGLRAADHGPGRLGRARARASARHARRSRKSLFNQYQ
jgi:hypothetical protein